MPFIIYVFVFQCDRELVGLVYSMRFKPLLLLVLMLKFWPLTSFATTLVDFGSFPAVL